MPPGYVPLARRQFLIATLDRLPLMEESVSRYPSREMSIWPRGRNSRHEGRLHGCGRTQDAIREAGRRGLSPRAIAGELGSVGRRS